MNFQKMLTTCLSKICKQSIPNQNNHQKITDYRNPLSAKSTAIHAELPANIKKKQSMKQCLPKSITIHAAMSADASTHH